MQTTSSGVQEFSEEEERDDATPLTQGDADLLGLRRSSFCRVCYSERVLSLSVQSHDSHCASSKNVWTSSISSSVLHSPIGWTSPEKVPIWASWVQPLVIRHRDSRVCRWEYLLWGHLENGRFKQREHVTDMNLVSCHLFGCAYHNFHNP